MDVNAHDGSSNHGKLVGQHDAILELVAQGQSLRNIAALFGVSPQAVDQALELHPQAAIYKRVGIVQRMEKREKQLEDAASPVDVTRADRLLGHARWLAERSDPDRWGAKQTVINIDANAFAEQLRKAQERVVSTVEPSK